MKKSFVYVTLGIISLALLLSVDAFAQRGMGKRMGQMQCRIADKLDLSTDQQIQIDKLKDKHQKSMIDYQAEMKKLSLDVKNLWKAEKPDKKQIEAATDKLGALKSIMQKEKLAHWFDVYNLLDDKQKESFKEMRQNFGKGMRQRMHRMRGDFPGRMGRPCLPLSID
ncbi:MAG: periplasmic heavy metal sensor [Bacteroidetes bacterium]|nr:periplasmic heavy metal sensor [Bacteroidota bacterium]